MLLLSLLVLVVQQGLLTGAAGPAAAAAPRPAPLLSSPPAAPRLSSLPAQAADPRALRVSSFRDITAFVMQQVQTDNATRPTVKWVKSADEAEQDLRSGAADLEFFSYDNTLTMALAENDSIVAVWPIHGGMLSLCGQLDAASNKTRLGIDTPSGYARALRQYVSRQLPKAQADKVQWLMAGATDLRFAKLAKGELDATLLNPPFTVMLPPGIKCTPLSALIGPYQGLNANVRKAWLADARNAEKLEAYASAFKAALARMRGDPRGTTAALARFYNISTNASALVYEALWQPNGLQPSGCYEAAALANTEAIFAVDTGIRVPVQRSWVNNSLACPQAVDGGGMQRAGSGGGGGAATAPPAAAAKALVPLKGSPKN